MNKPITNFDLMDAILEYREHQLQYSERVVLLSIAIHYNKTTGRCDPSIKKIQAKSGTSRATVHRAIKKARELKILYWNKLAYGNSKAHNTYCWKGLCPGAKPAWDGGGDKLCVVVWRHSNIDRSLGVVGRGWMTSAEGIARLSECKENGARNAAAISKWITHGKLSEIESVEVIENAIKMGPKLYDREDGLLPVESLVEDAIKEGFKHLNFKLRMDSRHTPSNANAGGDW